MDLDKRRTELDALIEQSKLALPLSEEELEKVSGRGRQNLRKLNHRGREDETESFLQVRIELHKTGNQSVQDRNVKRSLVRRGGAGVSQDGLGSGGWGRLFM